MDYETIIGIVIQKTLEALGSSGFNHNVQMQVRQHALDEIALREKYATSGRKAVERDPVAEIKAKNTVAEVKNYTPNPNETFHDIAKHNSEAVDEMMKEKKARKNNKA
jgi:hypothetical protein